MPRETLRSVEGRWRILLATLCVAAYGENTPQAWVVIVSNEKPIAQLELASTGADVYRAASGDLERAYARVVGRYRRRGWALSSAGRRLTTSPDGTFAFVVPITAEVTRVPLAATGPEGTREEETIELSVPDWQAVRREIASLPDLRETVYSAPSARGRWHVGAGADFGVSFYIPFAHVQYAVSDHVSLGLRGSYAGTRQSSRQQSGAGAFLDLSWYPGGTPFQGFYLQPKLGIYQVQNGSEMRTLPGASLVAGWRPYTGDTFDLGIGAGAHYVFDSDDTLSYTGFFPGLVFDAGFRF